MKLEGISLVKLVRSSQNKQQQDLDGVLGLLGNSSSILPNDTGQDTVLILQQMNDEMFVQLWPAVTFLALIMAFGVLGNLAVCYIFAFKLRGSAQNFLLLSIGVFDLLSCSLGIPGEIFDMMHYYYFISVRACKIMRFITSFPTMASILVLLIIAADRYRKVCEPLHGQIEPLQAKLAMIGVIIIALAFSFPALNIYGARTFPTPVPGLMGQECSISDLDTGGTYPLVYEITLCVAFVISATALVVIYFRVLLETRRHRRYLKKHAVPSFAKQSTSTSTREAEALLNSSTSKPDDVDGNIETHHHHQGKAIPPKVVASTEIFAGNEQEVSARRNKIKTFFVNFRGQKDNQSVYHNRNSAEADSGDIVIFHQGASVSDRNSLLTSIDCSPKDLRNKNTLQNTSCKCQSICDDRDMTVGPTQCNTLLNSSTQVASPMEVCGTMDTDVCRECIQTGREQTNSDSCTLRVTGEGGKIVREPNIEIDSLESKENNNDERRQSFPSGIPDFEDSRAYGLISQITCNSDIPPHSHQEFSHNATSVLEGKSGVSSTVARVEINRQKDSLEDKPTSTADTKGNTVITSTLTDSNIVNSEMITPNLQTKQVDSVKEGDLSKSFSSAASSGSDSSLPPKSIKASRQSPAKTKSFPVQPNSLTRLPKSQSNQSLLWNSFKRFQTDTPNQPNGNSSLQGPKLPHSSSTTALNNRSAGQTNTLTPLHKSKSTQSLSLMRVRKALRPTRMTVIACVITSAFIVSYLPHLSLVIMRSVFLDFEHQLEDPWLNLYNIFLRSYFVNNVINFFVYGTMSREFRGEVRKIRQNLKHMCLVKKKCRFNGT